MRTVRVFFIVVVLFCLGVTASAQSTVLSEGFETIPYSFSGSGSASWSVTGNLKAGGLYSDSAKLVNASDSAILTSNAFSTTGLTSVVLKFKHICKIDFFDGGYLEVSTNNGATWTRLDGSHYKGSGQFTSFNFQFKDGSYIDWAPLNNTVVPDNSWWKDEVFDISALAANSSQVKVRFVLMDMNFNGGSGAYGWLIDEIAIVGGTSDLVPPTIQISSGYPTGAVPGTGPFQVAATITDLSGVASAWVIYTIGAVTDSVPMALSSNSLYTASIPSQPYLTSVCYQIKATDSASYHNTAIYPAAGCTSFSNFKAPVSVQVGSATTSGYFSPLYCATATGADKYSQHISIFTPTELAIKGSIEALLWEKANSNGYTTSDAKLRIYLKHTTLNAVPSTAGSFATELAGATLVFEDTLLSLPLSAGWQNYIFNKANFSYNGTSNLMVMVDWYRPGNLSASNITWYYSTASQKALTFYGSAANPTASTGTGQRPNTKFMINQTYFDYDASIVNIAYPTGNVITAQPLPVLVNLKNRGQQNLTKATIGWSVNGVLQNPVYWTGILQSDMVASNITLGQFQFPTGSGTIKAWTTLPNDSVDQNPVNDTATGTMFGCNQILNGTYTVGSPTSDFQTMDDLFNALNLCGISGPCTFRIMPGIYNGSFKITDSISGLSEVNTITFTSFTGDPNSVLIKNGNQSAANNYVFNLAGAKYITIDKLKIKTESTSAGNCITLTNNAKYNTISGCVLEMVYGENYDVNGIIVSGGCHYNTIIGNSITNGYRSIVATGSSSTPIKHLTIENNTLTDGSRYAANLSYIDSLFITGNYAYCSFSAPSSSRYGLYIDHSTHIEVVRNKIHMHVTGYAYAIYYSYNNDASGEPSLIANNFIMVTGTSTVYGNHALNYTYNSNTRVYHNSMMVATGNSNAGTINFEGASTNLRMLNNTVANLAGGLAINHYSSAGPLLMVSDFNNFYTTGSTLVKWNSSNLVPVSGGISAFTAITQKDSNSMIANPMFYSNTNLHSFSPAMNNAATPAANIATDYDGQIRSVTTPDIGADEFSVSSVDAGIVAVTNPSGTLVQGNPIPVKVLIRNFGTSPLTSATVKYTINGGTPVSATWSGNLSTGQMDTVTLPNLVTPALAFTLTAYSQVSGDTLTFNDTLAASFFGNPLIDARIDSITPPLGGCNPGLENVTLYLKNLGQQSIASGLTAHYQLTGSSTVVSESVVQTIPANGTLFFTFTTQVNLQTIVDSLFILKAWTSHAQDPNPSNDTLIKALMAQAPLPTPLVSDTTILYGQTVALTATSGYPVEWYATATSTNKLGSGLTYTTPPLFDTTTYWAMANTNIPSGQFVAGQGTNISGQYEWPNPFGKAFGGAKHQFLILASELVSQGYSAGDISSVSFFSSAALGNVTGVDLLIGTTTGNQATTTFFTSPMQGVFSGTVDILGGWFTIPFNAPFAWDGSSNLVIQTITASGATLLNPPLLYDSTSFPSTIYYLGTNAATATSGTLTVKRHNIRINTIGTAGCYSARVPVTVNVPPLQKDVLVQDFAAPLSGCNIGTSPVTILVVNHGLDTIFGGIQARYKVNNGAFTSPETINTTIFPYDTLQYTFAATASFPSGATLQKHLITAVVSMAGDMYALNDTLLSDTIISLYTPAPLNINPVTLPYGTQATLAPTASDTLYWFNQPTGGTPFFSGIPFVTPLLYDTTVYYVESRFTTPLNTYQIGTSASYNPSTAYPTPYGSLQFGTKSQFLIRASELTALGMQKGDIQSVGFNVAAPGTSILQDYTIKLGHTSQTTMGTIETNLTTVFASPAYTVVSGINTHPVQVPFEWDGVSNLIVETCFKNYSNGTNAQVYNTNAGFTSTIIATGTSTFDCSTTSSAATYPARPNIYLKVISYGECASARVPLKVNVTGIPAVDAAVTQIISPQTLATSNTPTPVTVELKNYGTTLLTSAPVYYQVGNQTPAVYNWTGSLARLATVTVNLGNVTFTGGIESLKVWVAKTGDNTHTNDTVAETLNVCMQGIYTIGLGKRFVTITEAVNTLIQTGVCGHAYFDIDPGTYPERITFQSIPGSGPNTTVTFRSATLDSSDVTISELTNASTSYIVSLVNASYINLKHLTITANGSSNGYAVVLNGNSHHILISNCILNSASTSTSGNAAGVYSVSPNIHHITIYQNVIRNGFHSVYLTGSTSGNQKNITISKNVVSDFYQVGIYTYYQDTLEVSHNSIISGTSNQYYYGVRSYYLANTFRIHNNKMILYPTSYGYGVDINYSNGTASNYGLIYNNMISLLTGSGAHNGLYSVSNSYVRFAFNSIYVAGVSTTKRAMGVGSGSNNEIINNNFVAADQGYAFYTTVPGTITVMDRNSYYVGQPSQTFVHWGGPINTFAAFQAYDPGKNANSVSADPVFKNLMDLHADNVQINAKALPVAGITTDFDGQTRNAATPDIGADEFFPAPYDLSVLKIVKPFETSCGYTGTDSIIIRIRNAGENTFDFSAHPATIKVYITGYLTDSVQIVVSTGSLLSGNTLDITVHPAYNLSANGYYTFNSTVLSAIDTIPGNNQCPAITIISLPTISTFPYFEGFENGYDLTFNDGHGSDANLEVSVLAANNSLKGLHFEGGSYSGYNSPTTVGDAFGITTHLSTAFSCQVNPGSATALKMKLDLKQTYNATAAPNTSWFRVLVYNNTGTHYLLNTQGDSVFRAVSTNSDPFITQIFDLQPFLSQPFQISLEASCKLSYGTGTYSGDNVFVDNFLIWEPIQNDAEMQTFVTPVLNYGKVGTQQYVSVVVNNLGSQTITSLPLNYKVGASLPVNEVFTITIPSFTSDTLTFTVPFQVQPGDHSLCVFATLPGDVNHSNDTICKIFKGLDTYTIPFSDDFDGNQNWIATGTNNQWELGTPAMTLINSAHSGTNAWATLLTQDYMPNSIEILYSPYFVIPATPDTATLSFWQWMAVIPDQAYGIIQYSNNMGSSWNSIGYIGSVDGTNWYNAVVTGLHCWSNAQAGWTQSTHILYPSVFNTGIPFQLRFVFYSTNYTLLNNGWAIDDFAITIPPPEHDAVNVAIVAPQSSTAAGDPINVTMKVKNSGQHPISSLPLSYQIGSQTAVTETWTGSLPVGDTLTYTFTTPYTSPVSGYTLCTWAKLTNDFYTQNDTLCTTLIATPGKRDAGITGVVTPTGQVGIGSTVEVKVVLKNFGTDTLFSIPLEYRVNTILMGSETFNGTLLPGATTQYTFTTTYTSPAGQTNVCARPLLTGDVDPSNDEYCEPVVATGLEDPNHSGILIGQNIPNPANHQTTIPVLVMISGNIAITIQDLAGMVIGRYDFSVEAGRNDLTINTLELAAGIYLYTVEYQGSRVTKKMVVTR